MGTSSRKTPSNKVKEDTDIFAKNSKKSPTELIVAIRNEFSTMIENAF